MKPNLGNNMQNALAFIVRSAGWHSFQTRERKTVDAIRRLARHGLVEVNEFNQFRATEQGRAFAHVFIPQ